jgi:hypothetical protein
MASAWGVFYVFLFFGMSRASPPLTCEGMGPLPVLPSCYEGDVFGVEFLKATFKEQGRMQIDFWGAEQGCVNADYQLDGQIVTQSNVASCDGGAPPAVEFVLKYCSSPDRIVLQISLPIEHETYLKPVACASNPGDMNHVAKQTLDKTTPKKASMADMLACAGTNPPLVPSCYKGDVFGIEFLNVSFVEQGRMQIYFWGVEEGCLNAEYEHEGQILKQSKQTSCDGGAPPAAAAFVFKYCSSSDQILLEITQPVQHVTFLTPSCNDRRRLGTDIVLL